MSGSGPAALAVAEAHRSAWPLVLAATVRRAHDLDLAEECVQEAYADALRQWAVDGVPRNPAAWLTTAAHRRAVDAVRREVALRARLPLLVEPDATEAPDPDRDRAADAVVPDERLRLLLLCCHPALPPEGRTALTLRLVLGLPTADVARALLVSEATMAARVTRAKRKIAASRIPFRLPDAAQLPERVPAVLDVVHLLATAGHTAPSGGALQRVDLLVESVRLARMMRDLLPEDPEVIGLLALVLALRARSRAREAADGSLLRLGEQDRSAWDRAAVAEARALLAVALPHPRAGRFALQAAIAVLHAEAPSIVGTDWPQVLGLYDRLLEVDPSPVVALNRAVALAEVAGPACALREVTALVEDGRLAGYPYLPAVRADLLVRLGRAAEAVEEYRRAIARTANEVEAAFLTDRLARLGPQAG